MKRSIPVLSGAVVFFFTFNAGICKKNDTPAPPIPSASNVNVYVVGSDVTGGVMHAKCWKNGVETVLDNSSEDTYARDVYVAGGKVHVVGYRATIVNNQTVFRVKYWLNGVEQAFATDTVYGGITIPDGNTTMRKKISEQATAVYVNGTDVYIAVTRQVVVTEFGNILSNDTYCKYLKNGESHNIGLGNPSDITVLGADVYLSGLKNNYAAYWKNGTEHFLTDGTIGNSAATGIAVQGTNVYISGFENHVGQLKAKMWQNGNETLLTTGSLGEEARSVAINGNDIYICGLGRTVNNGTKSAAKYWKNGNAVLLTDGAASKDITHSIAINGQDVYVSGETESTMNGAERRIKYWKNGVATTLNGSNQNQGGKTAIFLEPY